jgi:hypothetical protein
MEPLKTKPTQLHLTEKLRQNLFQRAVQERRSASSLAEELLSQGLESRTTSAERIDQVIANARG